MMKTFNPYMYYGTVRIIVPCMYEPERDVSTCSDESDVSDFDKNKSEECSEET